MYRRRQHIIKLRAQRDAALEEVRRLRSAIVRHRDANVTACDDDSCRKGCGHDRRLYATLETDTKEFQ